MREANLEGGARRSPASYGTHRDRQEAGLVDLAP